MCNDPYWALPRGLWADSMRIEFQSIEIFVVFALHHKSHSIQCINSWAYADEPWCSYCAVLVVFLGNLVTPSLGLN